jgi:hypothetical protein
MCCGQGCSLPLLTLETLQYYPSTATLPTPVRQLMTGFITIARVAFGIIEGADRMFSPRMVTFSSHLPLHSSIAFHCTTQLGFHIRRLLRL